MMISELANAIPSADRVAPRRHDLAVARPNCYARAMRHFMTGLLLTGLAAACVPSQVPSQQVSEVARDLNVATRFGRMDVAMGHTAEAHQAEFLKHRAAWGNAVRVVDVEFAQLDMQGSDTADVLVDVSWMRMNEGLLRSTRLKQSWRNPGGGWKLSGEERVGGDLGLLGENVTVLRPDTRDVHFPTKTIGPTRTIRPTETIR